MDREAWRAAIHRVAKSRTRLSDRTELKPWQDLKLKASPHSTSVSCNLNSLPDI